ncbi:hypothetical protein [Haloferula sp. BvORR071]|uniref:hypothetical protein n=1 Tax=Haloferula sp. BvORR071 TaxID=1396141 RepID=UPI000556B259|nr:hypothetical protein [Haloferula sp. BvORR071]
MHRTSKLVTLLDQAKGYLALDMFEEAWQALDELPSDTVATPEMVRIRMRAAAGMQRWDFVHELALILRRGNEEDRFEAASAFQSMAAEHLRQGHEEDARKMAAAAIETRPAQRTLILEDPRFPANFI